MLKQGCWSKHEQIPKGERARITIQNTDKVKSTEIKSQAITEQTGRDNKQQKLLKR